MYVYISEIKSVYYMTGATFGKIARSDRDLIALLSEILLSWILERSIRIRF